MELVELLREKTTKQKAKTLAKIAVIIVVGIVFAACKEKNNGNSTETDECKEVKDNFTEAVNLLKTQLNQFDGYLAQCMQISGYVNMYNNHLHANDSLTSATMVYDILILTPGIWNTLTPAQQKVIKDANDIAIKAIEQQGICTDMITANQTCLSGQTVPTKRKQ